MAQITFSQDIICLLIAVGLIISFFFLLGNSYTIYHEEKSKERKNQRILKFFDFLRLNNGKKSSERESFGIINKDKLEENLEKILPRNIELKNIRVKAENKILFKLIKKSKKFDRSIKFPIIYENNEDKTPADLIMYLG